MNWIVFSYSLPAKSSSSPRVAVWRRLGRLGAVSPTSSVYILPARDECAEALQWLSEEIRQAKGEAVVMRVEQFEGLGDPQVIQLFNAARNKEYKHIEGQAADLSKELRNKKTLPERTALKEQLEKLQRQYAEIARIDYFDCPTGREVGTLLAQIAQTLSPMPRGMPDIPHALIAHYQDKHWVTRPQPHVDRLACIWLIRRFIDPNAPIRYAVQPAPDEISFDMNNAHFGHRGSLCTFETIRVTFGLDDPALRAIAEIVHEIDLLDGLYQRPETTGVDLILNGWRLAGLKDAELEAHGTALFEGLYSALAARPEKSAKGKRP